jgi:SAM-dependent methyltransferase
MIKTEKFQPIPVKSPRKNLLLFQIRCFVDLQLKTIVKHLYPAMQDFSGGDILDIGAGQSPWREWFPTNCRYRGIDVRDAQAFNMISDKDITLYDGNIIPFHDASFDGAICIEVLEHVENPEKLVSEIARILKNGSLLILTVPWSARRHHIPHDYHRFTRERLDQLFKKHGFIDVRIIERGNDVSVIANKFIVMLMRLLKPPTVMKAIWTLPLAVLVMPMASIMLLSAHISMILGCGASEDPLGYFVKAIRGPSHGNIASSSR